MSRAVSTADAEVKALRAEIDRLRALPVLATCGQCGYCHPSTVRTRQDLSGAWCDYGNPVSRKVDRYAAPPAWCPLRGAR